MLACLASNPGAHIEIVAAPEDQSVVSTNDDGVECAKAYEMLTPYATTERNLSLVTETLAKGCTKQARGGCKVNKQIIWQALENLV